MTEGDKVEAELRFDEVVNTYGVNHLVAVVNAMSDADIDSLVADYEQEYLLAPELARGGQRHSPLRYTDLVETGLRTYLRGGGFGALTTNFQDLGGLRQLPGLAAQRLMADGYGFGGEGDWKTSALLAAVKAMGAGVNRCTSFMREIHLPLRPRRNEDPRRAHAGGMSHDRRRTAVVRDPPPGHRRPR